MDSVRKCLDKGVLMFFVPFVHGYEISLFRCCYACSNNIGTLHIRSKKYRNENWLNEEKKIGNSDCLKQKMFFYL